MEYGPNIGELDFIALLYENKTVFQDKLNEEDYKLEIEFLGDKLLVKENNLDGYFGMNASFGGEYYKQE